MKKLFTLFAVCCMAFNTGVGQITGSGKPIGEIFSDFHQKLDKSSGTNGFDVTRAYVGYGYVLDNNFSATVVINAAGSPDDMKNGSVRRRYAYLRYASLGWSNEKLSLAFGMTDTRIYSHQQRWWGKRYIAGAMQSDNGHGVVADLGIVLDYKFSDKFSGDIAVMNGEGYLEKQLDDNVKTSLGFTVTPNDNFIFRVYGDHYSVSNDQISPHIIPGKNQFTGTVFAAYKNKYFYVGAEYSYKSNADGILEHDSWGISTTNGVYLSEKSELFFRYDYLKSAQRWDTRDGTFTIIGFQHTFSPNIRLSLNYQGTNPYYLGLIESRNLIYLNAHFRF